jgi:hypothetical protein
MEERPVQQHRGFWRQYCVPVALSLATFCAMNFLWNLPGSSDLLGNIVRYPVAVYFLGGSGLALILLLRAARTGDLSRDEVGLGPAGWAPPRRLGGLALILLLACGGWVGTVGLDRATWTSWGEFCFWFVVVLSASLAELLVFLGMGFCLTRRGLRAAGVGPLLATLIATGVCSISFGLYHYTYEPRWWPYVFPLMVEMALVVLFFLATRNIYLTFVFHNVMATLGFFGEQYSGSPQQPTYFSETYAFTANVLSFAVPFVLLHLLEWKGWRPAPAAEDNRHAAR